MPLVSVLLPVRDAAGRLGDCLASLLSQTLSDHEVIAVDDGSRDGSRAILESAARRDGRVRLLSSRGRGLVAALNTALAAARAPLAARMDADDVAHPERLALQSRRFRSGPPVDLLGCRVRLVGSIPGGNAGMRSYVAWQNGLLDHAAILRDLFVESPFVHPTVMAPTALLRDLGGYRELDGPEDYDLWLRAWARGSRFGKVDAVLLDWRDAPLRLTRVDPRYAPERFLARKAEALLGGPLSDGRPAVLWGAGRVGKAWSRALASRGVAVLGFVEVDPRKIGQRIHGAPVVSVSAAGAWPGALHLAAVGDEGARARIRREAARLCMAEGRDLVAVA